MSTATFTVQKYWMTVTYGSNRMVVPIDLEIPEGQSMPTEDAVLAHLTRQFHNTVTVTVERG